MNKFTIRITVGGGEGYTKKFWFISTNSSENAEKKFDEAVKELDYIYQSFGRFATERAVTNLFKKYGFEETIQ